MRSIHIHPLRRILPDLLVCSSAISACASSPGRWMRALEVTALADSATGSQLFAAEKHIG